MGLGFRASFRGCVFIYIYRERERERERVFGFVASFRGYKGILRQGSGIGLVEASIPCWIIHSFCEDGV